MKTGNIWLKSSTSKPIRTPTSFRRIHVRPSPPKNSPVNEEFFLYHTEPVESSGFCIHFKLPHYVTFQSSLDALRGATAKRDARAPAKTEETA